MAERPSEQGCILLLTVMVCLLLTGLGLGSLWSAQSGTRLSGVVQRRQEALFAARIGLEHAQALLQANAAWNVLLNNDICGGEHNDYIAPVEHEAPIEKGRRLCINDQFMVDLPVMAGAADQAGLNQMRYSIFVRNDATEGGQNLDTDRRIVVRVEGLGRDGRSFVALESVVSGIPGQTNLSRYSQAGGSAQGQNSGRTTIPDPVIES